MCNLVGLVEGENHTVAVAACLSKPDGRGRNTLRCINPTDQPLKLPASTKIGSYASVDDMDVHGLGQQSDPERERPGTGAEHVAELWEGGRA